MRMRMHIVKNMRIFAFANANIRTITRMVSSSHTEVFGFESSSKKWFLSILLSCLGFNRCPYQLLRLYSRHEESKSKIGQECSSIQQADYQFHLNTPWMPEVCPCKKKTYFFLAFAHESSKVRKRGKRSETGEIEARRRRERKTAHTKKNYLIQPFVNECSPFFI